MAIFSLLGFLPSRIPPEGCLKMTFSEALVRAPTVSPFSDKNGSQILLVAGSVRNVDLLLDLA
jgi:hypothetical protein